MAKIAAKSTRVYLNQYNVSGALNGWSQDVEQELVVVTCLSDDGPRRLAGNYDHKDGYTGFFEDTGTTGLDALVQGLIGDTEHYLCKVAATSISGGLPAEGSIAYESILRLLDKPLSAQVGGAVLLNFNGEGSNGITRAAVLRAVAAVGASNGTGQNLGATTAGQVLQAVYRVLAFNGTDITLTIQESTDDGGGDSYAAITGLAETFTAVGVARDTVVIATEAYKRVVISGTFTTATVLVTLGVVKGT